MAQGDPVKNIYNYLKENKLTESDFATWQDNFNNNPEVRANIHNYLTENELTSNSYDDWEVNVMGPIVARPPQVTNNVEPTNTTPVVEPPKYNSAREESIAKFGFDWASPTTDLPTPYAKKEKAVKKQILPKTNFPSSFSIGAGTVTNVEISPEQLQRNKEQVQLNTYQAEVDRISEANETLAFFNPDQYAKFKVPSTISNGFIQTPPTADFANETVAAPVIERLGPDGELNINQARENFKIDVGALRQKQEASKKLMDIDLGEQWSDEYVNSLDTHHLLVDAITPLADKIEAKYGKADSGISAEQKNIIEKGSVLRDNIDSRSLQLQDTQKKIELLNKGYAARASEAKTQEDLDIINLEYKQTFDDLDTQQKLIISDLDNFGAEIDILRQTEASIINQNRTATDEYSKDTDVRKYNDLYKKYSENLSKIDKYRSHPMFKDYVGATNSLNEIKGAGKNLFRSEIEAENRGRKMQEVADFYSKNIAPKQTGYENLMTDIGYAYMSIFSDQPAVGSISVTFNKLKDAAFNLSADVVSVIASAAEVAGTTVGLPNLGTDLRYNDFLSTQALESKRTEVESAIRSDMKGGFSMKLLDVDPIFARNNGLDEDTKLVLDDGKVIGYRDGDGYVKEYLLPPGMQQNVNNYAKQNENKAENDYSFARGVTETLPSALDFVQLMYLGGALTKGVTKLGLSKAAAAPASVFGISTFQMYGDSYADYIAKGLDPNDAAKYALGKSAAVSIIETLASPMEARMIAGGASDVVLANFRRVRDTTADLIATGRLGTKDAFSALGSAAASFYKDLGLENVTELIQSDIENAVDNNALNEKNRMNFNKTANIIFSTTAITAIPGFIGGASAYNKAKADITTTAIWNSTQNIEDFNAFTEELTKLNKLSTEDAAGIRSAVSYVKEELDQYEDATKENAVGATGLILTRRALESKLANTSNQRAKDVISTKIEGLNTQIDEILGGKAKVEIAPEVTDILTEEKGKEDVPTKGTVEYKEGAEPETDYKVGDTIVIGGEQRVVTSINTNEEGNIVGINYTTKEDSDVSVNTDTPPVAVVETLTETVVETQPTAVEISKLDITRNRTGYEGDFLTDAELIGDGSESTVYRKGDKVVKVSEPYNDASTYQPRVDDALLINELVGDGSLQVVGYYESPNGTKNPVYEQNYVEGETVTKAEAKQHLIDNKGFVEVGEKIVIEKDGKYYEVFDLTDNFIKNAAGDIVGIDAGIVEVTDKAVIDEYKKQSLQDTQTTEQGVSTTAPEIVQNTAPIATNTGTLPNTLTDASLTNKSGGQTVGNYIYNEAKQTWSKVNENGKKTPVNSQTQKDQLNALREQAGQDTESTTQNENPLKDVESTAKALELNNKTDEELEDIYNSFPITSSSRDISILQSMVEKIQEKRERQSVLNAPLESVANIVDTTLKKAEHFLERREGREAKDVAEKYLGDVSKQEARKDFKDAFFGNPNTWVADTLKMKESIRVFLENGGTFKELLKSVQMEFESDGFTEQDAATVINNKLNSITKNDFRQQQLAEAYHQAKEDGTNPELVEAIENLLGTTNNNTNEKESNNQTSNNYEGQTNTQEGQVGPTVGQEGEVSTTQTDGNIAETPSVTAETPTEKVSRLVDEDKIDELKASVETTNTKEINAADEALARLKDAAKRALFGGGSIGIIFDHEKQGSMQASAYNDLINALVDYVRAKLNVGKFTKTEFLKQMRESVLGFPIEMGMNTANYIFNQAIPLGAKYQRTIERVLATPSIPQALKDAILTNAQPKEVISDAVLDEMADAILEEADNTENLADALNIYDEIVDESLETLAAKIANINQTPQLIYEMRVLRKVADRLTNLGENAKAARIIQKIANIGSTAGSVLRELSLNSDDALYIMTFGRGQEKSRQEIFDSPVEEGSDQTVGEAISDMEEALQQELEELRGKNAELLAELIANKYQGPKPKPATTNKEVAKVLDAKAAEYFKKFREGIKQFGSSAKSGVDPVAMLTVAKDFFMFAFYKSAGSIVKARQMLLEETSLAPIHGDIDTIVNELLPDIDNATQEIAKAKIRSALVDPTTKGNTAAISPAQLIARRILELDRRTQKARAASKKKSIEQKIEDKELDIATINSLRDDIDAELLVLNPAKKAEVLSKVDDLLVALGGDKLALRAAPWVTKTQIRADLQAALTKTAADSKVALKDVIKNLIDDVTNIKVYTDSIAEEFIQRTGMSATEAAPFIAEIESTIKSFVDDRVKQRLLADVATSFDRVRSEFEKRIAEETAKINSLNAEIAALEAKTKTDAEVTRLKQAKLEKAEATRAKKYFLGRYKSNDRDLERRVKSPDFKRVIDAIVKGGLNNDTVANALADKLGLTQITKDQIRHFNLLADKIRAAESGYVTSTGDVIEFSREKDEAIRELKKFAYGIKKRSGLEMIQNIYTSYAYGNILSGPRTADLALSSGLKLLLKDMTYGMIQNIGKDIVRLGKGKADFANFRLYLQSLGSIAGDLSIASISTMIDVVKGKEGISMQQSEISNKAKDRLEATLTAIDMLETYIENVAESDSNRLAKIAKYAVAKTIIYQQRISRALVAADYISRSIAIPYAAHRDLTDMAMASLPLNPTYKQIHAKVNELINKEALMDAVNKKAAEYEAKGLKLNKSQFAKKLRLDFLPVATQNRVKEYADRLAYTGRLTGLSSVGAHYANAAFDILNGDPIDTTDSTFKKMTKLAKTIFGVTVKFSIMPFPNVYFRSLQGIKNTTLLGLFQRRIELDETGKVVRERGLQRFSEHRYYGGSVNKVIEVIEASPWEKFTRYAQAISIPIIAATVFQSIFGFEFEDEEEEKLYNSYGKFDPRRAQMVLDPSKDFKLVINEDTETLVTGAYDSRIASIINSSGGTYYEYTIYNKDSNGVYKPITLGSAYKDSPWGGYFAAMAAMQERIVFGKEVVGGGSATRDNIDTKEMFLISALGMWGFVSEAGISDATEKFTSIAGMLSGKPEEYKKATQIVGQTAKGFVRQNTPVSAMLNWIGNLDGMIRGDDKKKGLGILDASLANTYPYSNFTDRYDFDATGKPIPYQMSPYMFTSSLETTLASLNNEKISLMNDTTFESRTDNADKIRVKYSDLASNIAKYYPKETEKLDLAVVKVTTEEDNYEISFNAAKYKGQMLNENYEYLDELPKLDLEKNLKNINDRANWHAFVEKGLEYLTAASKQLEAKGLSVDLLMEGVETYPKDGIGIVDGGYYWKKAFIDNLIASRVFIDKDGKVEIGKDYSKLYEDYGTWFSGTTPVYSE